MNFNKTVGFNDVDFSEVELPYNPDHEDEPRYNDSSLFSVKNHMCWMKIKLRFSIELTLFVTVSMNLAINFKTINYKFRSAKI